MWVNYGKHPRNLEKCWVMKHNKKRFSFVVTVFIFDFFSVFVFNRYQYPLLSLPLVKTTTDGTLWLASRNCVGCSLSVAIYFGSWPFFLSFCLFSFSPFPIPRFHFPFLCKPLSTLLYDFWLFNSHVLWMCICVSVEAIDMLSSSTCPYPGFAWVNPTGLWSHWSESNFVTCRRHRRHIISCFNTTTNRDQ